VRYYPEFWGGKELAYPHVPKEHAKFARSQSIGNLVFVSGCQALDHETVRVETGDFEEQSRIVLGKVKAAMEETGGSLDTVLKTTVFVKDASMLPRYRDVERDFFGRHTPSSSNFVVGELPRREFLVEVEAVGVADPSAPGWETRVHPSGAVSAGGLLFLPAREGADVQAALDEVRGALERAGSSLDRLVKTTLAVLDAAGYEETRAAELEYYRRHAPQLAAEPPASTLLQVDAIGPGRAACQVDAIATLA
jgi:2-iminobutanoate/2-iminopropanoate deaminase